MLSDYTGATNKQLNMISYKVFIGEGFSNDVWKKIGVKEIKDEHCDYTRQKFEKWLEKNLSLAEASLFIKYILDEDIKSCREFLSSKNYY